MNLNLTAIGNFIQGCRKQLDMTQAELATRLNVSPQSVSNWERGESIPDVTVLPDLACILHCSIDAILCGGGGNGGYRRYVTVSQMREALSAINRIGELLGRDHFIYTCIINALNERMNTTVEESFSDPHIFELFVGEFLIGCIRNGDYVDPRDVQAHIEPGFGKDYILNVLNEVGIK